MPRLVTKTLTALRRFARARQGATAVEFAIVSIPLMLLMFGVLELAIILLVTSTLDTATDFAARNIRTGEFQTSGKVTPTDFRGLVCRNMSWLSGNCSGANMTVEAETFDNFADTNQSHAVPPAELDPDDPDQVCWSVGNPQDIVLVRTYFTWPIITPLLSQLFQNNGKGDVLLSSVRIFRNEPYDASLKPLGAEC